VIRVRLDRISDSCGFGVPLLEQAGERPQRGRWLATKGPEGLREYVAERNAESIDGLPAFTAPAPAKPAPPRSIPPAPTSLRREGGSVEPTPQ
jgi:hypothetical protein